MPLNKSKTRDSCISDDGDFVKDNVENSEEFKQAVEAFDHLVDDKLGSQTPEVKRLSLKCEASPNVNWKRIKTSKSLETDDSNIQQTLAIKEEIHLEHVEQQNETIKSESITEEKSKKKNKKSKKNKKTKDQSRSDEDSCINNSNISPPDFDPEAETGEFLEEDELQRSKISLIGEQYIEKDDDEDEEEVIVEKVCLLVKEGIWTQEKTRISVRLEPDLVLEGRL